MVYETVAPNGKRIDSIEGRLLNPGHAIEAGWFLLRWAQKLNRSDLKELAFHMIDWSYNLGWDTDKNGLFLFLDSEVFTNTFGMEHEIMVATHRSNVCVDVTL